MIEHALEYAARGWKVFPCKPKLKIPATAHGVKDASSDPETIRAWWKKWPTANIALACGPDSGVYVVDVDWDPDKGVDGFGSMKQLPTPQTTVCQRTPRGGAHLLFRADTPPANKNNFRNGIDIRSAGYYIILAPSIHPNGGTYQWVPGRAPGDIPLADYPDAFRPELDKATPPPMTTPATPPPTTAAAPTVIERATKYLNKIPPAIQGQGGHDALLWAARAMVTGFNLDDATALALLWSEYNPRCSPPWVEGDSQDRKDFERKVFEARTLPSTHPVGWLLKNTLKPNPNNGPQKKHIPVIPANEPPPQNNSGDPLKIAKDANKKPFSNFEEETDADGKTVKRPRLLRNLRADAYRRFCGFPRVLGGTLFDQDHNSDEIHEIYTVADLFSWMQDKSQNIIKWWSGMGFVTKEEFLTSFLTPHHGQRRYDAVSKVPDYPPRADVYYHHPPLPPPTPNHSAFWEYIDRFLFTTVEDRHLYASCVLDALRFDPGGKPLFVFVSPDGMGSGKSQGAEQLAYLLGSQITKTTPREITERQDDLLKRILSTSGRKNRIMLLDNITGKIRSDELASLITAHSFSGRPAYARGEESRKNDLLFILTSNGAVLNSDLAVRSVFISFRKPETPGRWKEETRAWSDANRLQVFADAIDMFQRYPASTSCVPTTRFAGWETQSLWAACQGSADLHDATLFLSIERSSDSNDDVDLSETIKEAIEHALRVQCPSIYSAYSGDSKVAVFVQSSVMADWLEKPLAKVFPKANMIIPAIRDLVKSGHLPIIENHDSKGWRFRCRTGQKRGFILRKVHANPAGILSQDNNTYCPPTYSVVHRDGMVEEIDLLVTPL